mgnify:CR=1 FL=1
MVLVFVIAVVVVAPLVRFAIERPREYFARELVALIQAYADGLDCEQGASQALAMPLSEVERDWRSSELGEDRGAVALLNLFPYLAVLGMMLLIPLAYTVIPARPK